ncbi:hypothetical protein [Nostoc sp.]|uniref:hypothetical protein n=1 Tax=Nostoc sp. TaxID=1180 RepID=UPI002FF9EBF0
MSTTVYTYAFTRQPACDRVMRVYDRIKLSNPQLTIRVLCPNPDDCVLIKLIYEIVRSPNSPS